MAIMALAVIPVLFDIAAVLVALAYPAHRHEQGPISSKDPL